MGARGGTWKGEEASRQGPGGTVTEEARVQRARARLPCGRAKASSVRKFAIASGMSWLEAVLKTAPAGAHARSLRAKFEGRTFGVQEAADRRLGFSAQLARVGGVLQPETEAAIAGYRQYTVGPSTCEGDALGSDRPRPLSETYRRR